MYTFQHQCHGHLLKSPLNNSDTAVPVVHPADGKQISMVPNHFPGSLSLVIGPGQRQQPDHTCSFSQRMAPQASIQFPQATQNSCQINGGNDTRKCLETSTHKNSPDISACTSSLALDSDHLKRHSSDFIRSSPLLYSFLKDSLNSVPYPVKAHSSLLDKNNADKHEVHSNSLRVKSLPAGLNCQQPRSQKLDHLGGTVSYQLPPPTDDQIREYIDRSIACYSTFPTRQRSTYSNEELNSYSVVMHSSVQVQESNSVAHLPVTRQYTAAGGQALNPNAAPTSRSGEAGDGTAVLPKNPSTGISAPSVEHSEHAPKDQSVEKSGSVDLDLPVKSHLDVTMLANDGKHVYSDDCGDSGSNDKSVQSKLCDKYLEKGVVTLHYSLTALKELIASLEKVEIIAQKDNVSKVILQKYWNGDIGNVHLFTSTEYPQIMMNAVSTCTKKEDERPVVLTTMSGMILEQPTDKYPISFISCSSSQEKYKSSWLNFNQNLEDIDKVPGVCGALKSRPEQEKEETNLKPVDAAGLDSVRVTDISEGFQGSSSSVEPKITLEQTPFIKHQNAIPKKDICMENVPHANVNSSNCIHNTVSLPANQNEQLCKDGSSHYELRRTHTENDVGEQPSFSENKIEEVNGLKYPQYEDISDDEGMSQLLTRIPKFEKEVRLQPQSEYIQYDDISEDDSPQDESSTMEMPENKNNQSEGLSEEQVVPLKQVSPEVETATVDQDCVLSCFVEPDENQSCLKFGSDRDLECQTSQSVSQSPSSVLKDVTDQIGDEDDEWLVVPICIADLEFEPYIEAQDDLEVRVQQHSETERLGYSRPKKCSSHQPEPASVSEQVEVFDTIECFRQAKAAQFMTRVSTSIAEGALNMAAPCTASGDSSDTEDSCDYSTESEHNFLTVTRHLLENTSAPGSPKPNSDHEATNTLKGLPKCLNLQKLKELMVGKAQSKKRKAKRQNSESEDIIILSSDCEGELDQTCKKAKKKRHYSSSLKEGEMSPCRPQQGKDTQPSADSPKLHLQFEEVMEGTSSDASTERVQHVTIGQNAPIVIDSDTEDEWDQRAQLSDTSDSANDSSTSKSGQHKSSRQTTSNTDSSDSDEAVEEHHRHKSRSSDSGDAVFAKESRNSPETANSPCKDSSEKHKKPTSSKESTQLLPRSADHSLNPKLVTSRVFDQKTCSTNSDQAVKKHHGHKSRSSDSGSAVFAKRSRNSPETANNPCKASSKKHKKPTSSSKESTRLCPHTADLSLNPKLVIPRLFVQKTSPHSKYLKLAKEFKGRPDEDETPATMSPRTGSEKVVSQDELKDSEHLAKSKLGNDRPCAAKKKVQFDLTTVSPSTSSSRLTSTNGQPPTVRQSSHSSRDFSQSVESPASYRRSKSVPIPTYLSRTKYSNTSTLDHTSVQAKGPSPHAAIPLAKQQVISDWSKSHVPIRRDRNHSLGTEEHPKRGSSDSVRKPRPDPIHKRRHSSNEAVTPLMKRAKLEAIQRTKDINRDNLRDQRHSVGTGYKWLETPSVARPSKGSDRRRCRSSLRLHH